MWHSPFNPNLFVDYGNMIHFSENAWTSEGRLNLGRIRHNIGQNRLSVQWHLWNFSWTSNRQKQRSKHGLRLIFLQITLQIFQILLDFLISDATGAPNLDKDSSKENPTSQTLEDMENEPILQQFSPDVFGMDQCRYPTKRISCQRSTFFCLALLDLLVGLNYMIRLYV